MRAILTSMFLIAFFTAPLSAQELTGTLQQIQKSGKIKIGYRKSQPPMSFLGKDNMPAGYSIDLCRHIVDKIEKKVGKEITIKYVPVTARERFAALSDNRIDILCGSTTKTLSRSEIVDFTQLTFVTGAAFVSLKSKKIRGNFKGKKVGVVHGTTTAQALKELFQETSTEADIVLFKSAASGFDALIKENIDVFSSDQVVLIGLVLTADDPNNFTILPDLFTFEPFALAVRRNDADFRLVADRVISDLYRSKKILEIYDKWVGAFTGQRLPIYDAMIQLNATPE